MAQFMIVPGDKGYWIMEVAIDGSRTPRERFDTEDAAVQRLRVLEQNARLLAEQNPTPSKKAP
jgi:hypothetical protein